MNLKIDFLLNSVDFAYKFLQLKQGIYWLREIIFQVGHTLSPWLSFFLIKTYFLTAPPPDDWRPAAVLKVS